MYCGCGREWSLDHCQCAIPHDSLRFLQSQPHFDIVASALFSPLPLPLLLPPISYRPPRLQAPLQQPRDPPAQLPRRHGIAEDHWGGRHHRERQEHTLGGTRCSHTWVCARTPHTPTRSPPSHHMPSSSLPRAFACPAKRLVLPNLHNQPHRLFSLSCTNP